MDLLIVFAAKYLILVSIIIALGFFLTHSTKLKKDFSKFLLFTFALAIILARLFGSIFQDPRPFVSDHIRPLITHAADNGFPSDHTLLTMAIAGSVFVYNKKLGIFLAIISTLVGLSRVLAGVHHVIDIIGAIRIALTATFVARKVIVNAKK